MVRKIRKLKVQYRDFSGQYWGCATDAASDGGKSPIYIDPRAKGKKHLEILIHESAHVLFPDLTEEAIERVGVILSNTLWYEGYRRTDNDTSVAMQDGKK